MEWPYSECGGDSDIDDESFPDTNPPSSSFTAEQTEVVQLLDQTLALPKGLCAQPQVFWEFFSLDHLWNELPEETQETLKTNFLPHFPENDAQEKEETIQKIFHCEPLRFDRSPLVQFQKNLEEGNYLTDVIRYREKIAKSERHEQRYQECEYISRVARKMAASRKALLERAYSSSYSKPSSFSSSIRSPSSEDMTAILKGSVAANARKRYLNEISTIASEANLSLSDSDDEAAYLHHPSFNNNNNNNNSNNTTNRVPRKQGRPSMGSSEMLTPTGEPKVYSTFAYKSRPGTADSGCPDVFQKIDFNENYLRQTLRRHRKRRTEDPDNTDPPFYDFLMQDMFNVPDASRSKQPKSKKMSSSRTRIKTESPCQAYLNSVPETRLPTLAAATTSKDVNRQSLLVSNNVLLRGPGEVALRKFKLETATTTSAEPVEKRAKMSTENLAATVKKEICVEAVDDLSSDPSSSPLSTHQHACLMSLVRSIFCSTPDHRITLENLQRIVRQWLVNGKSKANDWFSDCHSWLDELPSVVKFLAGDFAEQPDDYVPYIEYKTQLRIYQWIGAGRDTDQHLLPLYRFWLDHRQQFGRTKVPPLTKGTSRSSSSNLSGDFEDVETQPPAPRCPTTWIMRPERAEEIAAYHLQERQRYESPSAPFTYRMHGYESVVGPVHGVYAQAFSKGANLLLADRPACVTLTSLVRDAVARLPNGEGSKAHVCEMLKASQYVVQGGAMQVAVNSLLERLQSDSDRCVYFDPRRRVYVYAHRAKTEADFRSVSRSVVLSTTTPTTTYKRVIVSKLNKAKAVDGGQVAKQEQELRKSLTYSRGVSRTGTASLIKMDQIVVKGTSQGNSVVMASSPTPSPSGLSAASLPGTRPFNVSGSSNIFKIRATKPAGAPTPITVMRGSSPSQLIRSSTSGSITVQAGKAVNYSPLNKIVVGQLSTDVKDVEANMDASHPPALIPKLTYNKGTIKVTNSAGVQSAFQVSSQASPLQRPSMSLLNTAQGQSVLMHNQRTVKVAPVSAPPQSVYISSTNPSTLVSSVAAASGGKTVARLTNANAILPTVTKVVRAIRPGTSPVAVAKKPIQIRTSSGNISVVEKTSSPNGNVLRNATPTSLLGTPKPIIQNIVIRSSSPQAQGLAGKRSIPLKTYSMLDSSGNAPLKSMLMTSSAGDSPNVIKIRTSVPNSLMGTTTSSSLHTPKSITSLGGTQILHIQQPQQFILNSVRQGNTQMTVNLPNSIAVKGPGVKQVGQTGPHVVQLPPKTTLLKGSPITARVLKSVLPNTSQGSSSASIVLPTQSQVVRTMSVASSGASGAAGGSVQKVLANRGLGQLVTLVDTSGSGKATHTTPIRIAKSNVIQLSSAANGQAGAPVPGTQYTLLSPGRSMIQVQQQQQQKPKVTVESPQRGMAQPTSLVGRGAKPETGLSPLVNAKLMTAPAGGSGEVAVGMKTGIRMVNAANITRIGKPVLISNKMTGNVASLLRASTSIAKMPAATTTSTTTTSNSLVIDGQTVKVPSSINLNSSSAMVARTQPGTTMQHVMITGNQFLKIQSSSAANQGKLIKTGVPIVKGTSIKATPGATTNRVVLVQGPSGQLILPNLQGGGSINLKSLKMISLQQQQQPPQPK